MDVGNVAGKGRSLQGVVGSAWKRLLEKNNKWVMREHIGLKLKKFIKPGDTTNVPREYIKRRITVECDAWREET